MASISKHGKKWRAQIDRRGKRMSRVCETRTEAKNWAARQEYLILHEDETRSAMPFGDLLDRYGREVSSKKRGGREEIVRIERLRRDKIAKVSIGDLTAADFADWRDRRLKEVKGSSVRREMEQLSAVLTVARKEWGVISHNPLQDVRRPPQGKSRDRLPTAEEIERLRLSAGEDLNLATARVFHAWLFSIETALRAGEVAGLTWDDVDLERRTLRLTMTKNGSARDVPLSTEAVRLLRALPDMGDTVFDLTSASISALWVKLRNRAGVDNLTYHDSRHAAITQLARKLDVLDLARMVGHRNISQLMTYYNATAEELAQRLD